MAAAGRTERLTGEGLARASGSEAVMDDAAFTAFYERTAPRLWKYLRRLSNDAALADDVLQEAYLRFLHSVRVEASENEQRAFLYRVATRLVYDHWRRRRREAGTIRPLETPAPDRSSSLGPDLSRVFGTLKPRERALLWLAHVEGWSHREIGAALGIGPTSVRVLLFRARRILAGRLRKAGLIPPGGSP
jgi:RNA polymerase sigma-70 factor, ECF subfamily